MMTTPLRLPARFTPRATSTSRCRRELIAQHPAAERSGSRLLDGTRRGAARPRVPRPARPAARRRPARRQRHARDQGAAARRQGERRRGRGAGRADRGRTTRARAAAREQVAEAGQPAAPRRRASRPRCSAAAAPTASLFELRFPADPLALLERHGHVPLPPYIAPRRRRRRRAPLPDRVRGAAGRGRRADRGAALRRRAARGARARAASSAARSTLHVGAGTFQPVRSEDLAAHVMHSERFEVGADAVGGDRADAGARRPGRRGRHDQPARARIGGAASASAPARRCAPAQRRDPTLHHAGLRVPRRRPAAHQLPPAEEHAADAGLAPSPATSACARSTAHAIAERYRFFSYGDAMLLARGRLNQRVR